MAKGGRHMHKVLRVGLEWGILAAFGVPGFAHERGGKVVSEQPLTIRIYNSADVPPRTLNDAMRDATRILATAGVGAIWQGWPADAREAHTIDLSRAAAWRSQAYATRNYIAVRILRGAPARYFPSAFGYALPDAQIGVNATIFYDRIERLNESGAVDPATVLGHVMAHEIGHVLLGSTEHCRTGIMKGSWSKADFQNLAPGSADFTALQFSAIRNTYQFHRRCRPADSRRSNC
jgi:hypothetical protein